MADDTAKIDATKGDVAAMLDELKRLKAVSDEEGEGTKDDRVQIIVRTSRDERRALKAIANTRDTTVQALCESAIRDIIAKLGGK